MDLGLHGKVALITGGTGGIGLAIAARLLAEGARVTVSGRDADRLARAVKGLDTLGDVRGVPADVRDPRDVERLVSDVASATGALNIVVSNAGADLRGNLDGVGPEAVSAHFSTKVLGAWALAGAARPHLRRARGRFIVVVGPAGKVPGADILPDAVVDAAQHAFVKSLSDEFGREGILVNAVRRGAIKDPRSADAMPEGEIHLGRSLEQQEARWGALPPRGRSGTPDDVAAAVAFLASARAGFLCGANVDVDGGGQRMIF